MNKLLKKLINKIMPYFIKFYLYLCMILFKRSSIHGNLNTAQVVVTLTSYYKRFSTLKWTLQSLIQQRTTYNYRLILVLSKYDIEKYGKKPDYLADFEKRGLEVIIVEENLKSYKKAFYTYDLGLPLITADDDVYYPSWWLERLMDESKKMPETVLAFRGHYILVDKINNKFKPYKEWLKKSDKLYIDEANYSFLPTGTSGIFYPVGALNGLKETKNKFLDICPHADDFWFKYICTINKYKTKRITVKNIHFILMSKGESLFDINVEGGNNDIQFNKILDYSPIFHKILKRD